MKKTNYLILIISLIMLLLFSQPLEISATSKGFIQSISVKLDYRPLSFNVEPRIINNRTIVPLRTIFESLGIELTWLEATRTIIGQYENIKIELQIDNRIAVVNGKEIELDVPPFIDNNRTLIPARFIAEATGARVVWDNNSRTVIITTKPEFVIQDIKIGDTEELVIKKLGEPSRKDLSKYGFDWYIYNHDYSKYIQVGIKDGIVVGLYTNTDNWKSEHGVEIGTKKADVNKLFGEPLKYIQKGNVLYNFNYGKDEADTYLIEDYYITIFYDVHNDITVTSVQIVEKSIEESMKDFYGEPNEELRKSFERQIFDLANVSRVRNGKRPLVWDVKISNTAREHSKDMALNEYFDHINSEGMNPFERIEEDGIKYSVAAENIAAGQTSAIFAHEKWMNSIGHRNNILADIERIGVGVYFGGKYKIYFTQDFYTPR